MSELPKCIVIGVGRVGSYAKAKRGHYSRSRHHWAIATWSNECRTALMKVNGEYVKVPYCKCKETGIHYPQGYVEDTVFGPFKTKTAAEKFLADLVDAGKAIKGF